MKLNFTLIGREELRRERAAAADQRVELLRLSRDLTQTLNELNESRRDLSKIGPQLAQLSEKLSATQTLAAQKQQDIAGLRAQLAERELAVKTARDEARDERQKLMDWIAKGVSNGVPIFAETPAIAVEEEAPAPAPAPSTDAVPSELQDAIRAVGRRPRALVKHIERKREVDFEGAMKSAGVRRVFAEERATGEAEAVAINESKTA